MPSSIALPPPPSPAPDDISLFIDFDGTLVELAGVPDGVTVAPSLISLLGRLAARLSGRLALVSGRSIVQLDDLLGPSFRSLTTVGSHGAEIRPIGSKEWNVERPQALIEVETVFRKAFHETEGVVIEVKSLGVAVHYRQNPAAEAAANSLALELGLASTLEVQQGKMMVELRLGGHDKGSAIATLMRSAPFAGHSPYFCGDDVTDETGFECCATLGGAGILVGPDRPTAARYRLHDVDAVHAWLSAL